MSATHRRAMAAVLANAFLAGPWKAKAIAQRGADCLGHHYSWMPTLAQRVHHAFPVAPTFAFDALVRFLVRDEGFVTGPSRELRPRVHRLLVAPGTMAPPIGPRASWPLPVLSTPGDLANWLGLTAGELEWFADRRGLERLAAPRLQHYVYTWAAKPTGGVRLLEAPKSRMKALQRRVLHELLAAVPPHPAAHGFRSGRNVVSYATPHVGRDVVVRLDLADFFLSIPIARISAIFRACGYSTETARALAGITTNRASTRDLPALPHYASFADVQARHLAKQRYGTPHLPQGAPTSPALANLSAFGLDTRLHAAALSVGATYTRYADDLAFSGGLDFARRAQRFAHLVGGIALDEGFTVNLRKTRIMPKSTRQVLAGIVVNEKLAIPRDAFERLEATLYNCVRRGPTSQNRDPQRDFRAHLRGRIAWVRSLDEGRAAPLEALFRTIEWPV